MGVVCVPRMYSYKLTTLLIFEMMCVGKRTTKKEVSV